MTGKTQSGVTTLIREDRKRHTARVCPLERHTRIESKRVSLGTEALSQTSLRPLRRRLTVSSPALIGVLRDRILESTVTADRYGAGSERPLGCVARGHVHPLGCVKPRSAHPLGRAVDHSWRLTLRAACGTERPSDKVRGKVEKGCSGESLAWGVGSARACAMTVP